jgi:hypothetical protein
MPGVCPASTHYQKENIMDFNTLFPSNYLKAADATAPLVFTIKAIVLEEIGDEKTKKPVIFFFEETRGLVLNKTNGQLLAHCFGNDTDSWLNRQIELYSEPVQFQGRIVSAIRVRPPQQAAPPPQPIAAVQQPQAAPQPVAAVQQPQAAPQPVTEADIDY